MDDIKKELESLKDNHLHHIQSSVSAIERNIVCLGEKMDSFGEKLETNTQKTIENSTNISWMRWILMAMGGAVVVQVVTLIFKQ